MKSAIVQPIGRLSLPERGTIFAGKRYTPGAVDLLFQKLRTRTPSFHGVLAADSGPRRLFLTIVDNEPYAAGEEQQGIFVPLSLHGWFSALQHLPSASLTMLGTDPLFLKSLLTLIQRVPTTEGTTELMDISSVVEHLKKHDRDQLLVARREAHLSLFYFRRRNVISAYFADPDIEASEESTEERLLAYVYRHAPHTPLALYVFAEMTATPAEDGLFARGEWPDTLVDYFSRPLPHLLIIGSDRATRRWELKASTVTLGRGNENDLVIDDPAISRRHLVFRRVAEGFMVEDCGSRNGTLYNGAPLRTLLLHQGAELQIGECLIRFFGGDAPERDRSLATRGEETIFRPAGDASVPLMDRPPETAKPVYALEIVAADGTRRRVHLTTERMTVGRSKADLVIPDTRLSRRHGELEVGPEGIVYRDTGSTNGSQVNGQSVTTAVLKPGDVLTLGETSLTVILDAA